MYIPQCHRLYWQIELRPDRHLKRRDPVQPPQRPVRRYTVHAQRTLHLFISADSNRAFDSSSNAPA